MDRKKSLEINSIRGEKVKLVNIDGLGSFENELSGQIESQQNVNSCVLMLDKELLYNKMTIKTLNITTRHKSGNLNKLRLKGVRRIFNIPPIIAVNVIGSNNCVSFRAEIKMIK